VAEGARAARYSDLFGPGEPDGRTEDARGQPSECSYCPFCAAIRVLSATRPEALDHIGIAARELVAAAGIIMQEFERVIGSTPSEDHSEAPGVHRIG
jgi:hypothetical protein